MNAPFPNPHPGNAPYRSERPSSLHRYSEWNGTAYVTVERWLYDWTPEDDAREAAATARLRERTRNPKPEVAARLAEIDLQFNAKRKGLL